MNSITDARALKQYVLKNRKYFHENPELSFHEDKTKKRIISELEKLKIEYITVSRNSVIAFINRKKNNKVIAFRTGIDAIATEEKSDILYPSKYKGKAHLCGHDISMAILLGLLKMLKYREKSLDGQVIVIFEEANEIHGGSKSIIEANVLKKIDYFYSFHAVALLNYNQISIKSGKALMGNEVIKMAWHGISSHSSKTSVPVDAIYAASLFSSNIQSYINNAISINSYANATTTKISGGKANNAISNYCETTLNIRFDSDESRAIVYDVINNYLTAIKLQNNVEGVYSTISSVAPVINDYKAVELGNNALKKLNEIIKPAHLPILKESDSLSDYFQIYRGAICSYGVSFENKTNYYNHHESFLASEESFTNCLALHFQIIYDYFGNNK